VIIVANLVKVVLQHVQVVMKVIFWKITDVMSVPNVKRKIHIVANVINAKKENIWKNRNVKIAIVNVKPALEKTIVHLVKMDIIIKDFNVYHVIIYAKHVVLVLPTQRINFVKLVNQIMFYLTTTVLINVRQDIMKKMIHVNYVINYAKRLGQIAIAVKVV
jgi:hypothetical protein